MEPDLDHMLTKHYDALIHLEPIYHFHVLRHLLHNTPDLTPK